MDPQPPHPDEAPTLEGQGERPSGPPATATTKPDSRKRLDNPLQAVLGAVILLLGFALTQTNDRITQTNDRITRLENKIDERFSAQDERLDEINLKLTALIAALNAAAEVEATLDGRLLDPKANPGDEPAN